MVCCRKGLRGVWPGLNTGLGGEGAEEALPLRYAGRLWPGMEPVTSSLYALNPLGLALWAGFQAPGASASSAACGAASQERFSPGTSPGHQLEESHLQRIENERIALSRKPVRTSTADIPTDKRRAGFSTFPGRAAAPKKDTQRNSFKRCLSY